jgi:hypothetical protein
MNLRPIIMLDFDEVIVLNRPEDVGGFDAISANPPPDFWKRLFHRPAMTTLVEAISTHQARIVITTSWLRFLGRDGFEHIFKQTELDVLSESLHDCWEAPQNRGETRAQAIDRWLEVNHRGEPYIILDDEFSGTGLRKSIHDRRKRVIFCKVDVGLHEGHLPTIRAALSKAP